MRTGRWPVVVVALASCLPAGDAAAQGPIKIGCISPLSGAIAAPGKDMYSGCELHWQEISWQGVECQNATTALQICGEATGRSHS